MNHKTFKPNAFDEISEDAPERVVWLFLDKTRNLAETNPNKKKKKNAHSI